MCAADYLRTMYRYSDHVVYYLFSGSCPSHSILALFYKTLEVNFFVRSVMK